MIYIRLYCVKLDEVSIFIIAIIFLFLHSKHCWNCIPIVVLIQICISYWYFSLKSLELKCKVKDLVSFFFLQYFFTTILLIFFTCFCYYFYWISVLVFGWILVYIGERIMPWNTWAGFFSGQFYADSLKLGKEWTMGYFETLPSLDWREVFQT